MVSRSRRAFRALAPLALAAIAAACDDPAPGTGAATTSSASSSPSSSASALSSSALPAASAAPSASAVVAEAPLLAPELITSGASSAPPPPAAAPAAPGGKVARSSKTGILKAGEADRLIPKGSASKVRLLDGGAEPRAVLRYALTPGETTAIEMGLTMTLEMSQGARAVPAQKLPRIATLLDLATAAKGDAGSLGVEATVRGVSIAKDAGLPQQVADKLLPHLKSIEGLKLQYQVTPEGRVKQAGGSVPGAKGGAADTTLAQMTQSLESMIAPFPDEPIGLGARWEVLARFDSSGTELVQWSTFELRERSDEGAKLGLEVKQAAARADVHPPNLPPGVAANLVSFSSSGTGESVIELVRPAPKAATMRVDSEMTLEVDKGGGGEKAQTTMKSSMLVDMGRAKAGGGPTNGPAKAPAKAPASP